MASKSQEKAWRYVGRFMESVANVEASVDEIFAIMFNLDDASMLLILGTLDFRKKVTLVELGFKHLGIDPGKMLSRIHEFYSIRNAIAHSQFDPAPSCYLLKDGVKVRYGAGIDFWYIDQSGRMRVPRTEQARNRKQKEIQKRKSLKEGSRDVATDYETDICTIAYSEFDEYDAQLRKIMEALLEMKVSPINKGIDFIRDIREIVASSDNVVFLRPEPEAH